MGFKIKGLDDLQREMTLLSQVDDIKTVTTALTICSISRPL